MTSNSYYTTEQHGEFDVFSLGDFVLEHGATLRNAQLAYKTFGRLNEAGDNAILFPVMFSGTHAAMAPYVGEGLALDPTKYFIVIPNQLGSGLSTSPHNTSGPYAAGRFPMVTIGDDVRAQHKLLTEQLGVKRLQLVTGWSMGAQQTYEWAVRYADMVARAAPIAGTAKTTAHCTLYVDVVRQALTSDPAWANGNYQNAADVQAGLQRVADIFAMMGACPEFYNREEWAKYGFSSVEDHLKAFWETWFFPMDPNNLLCQLAKWRAGDVGLHSDGNLSTALSRVTAKVFVIAFERDMFVLKADCRNDQQMIKNSELVSIDSYWGHFSMFGVAAEDFQAINNSLEALLACSV